MKKILVVEDDIDISNMLCELLMQNHYMPVAAFSGSEALLCLEHQSFNLILLDLILPGKTGIEVLNNLRERSQIPVIVMTAISGKDSIVNLLGAGANDYLTKPFDNRELLARIDVQLRETQYSSTDEQLIFEDIVLDMQAFDAIVGGVFAQLSKTEYAILKLLISHPKKVFTKNNLYESVWGEEFLGDDNTINVHISNLRTKLTLINPGREYIKTIWGIGFRMNEKN